MPNLDPPETLDDVLKAMHVYADAGDKSKPVEASRLIIGGFAVRVERAVLRAASREQPSEPPPLSDDMKQLMSDASWMIGAIEGDEKATPSQKMRAKRSWLIIKRLAESVASHGPEKAPRNEWRLDERGDLDDVVVEDVATFRLERMGDDHVWGRIYHRDGSQTDFNLHAERLSLTHEHDSPVASHGPQTPQDEIVRLRAKVEARERHIQQLLDERDCPACEREFNTAGGSITDEEFHTCYSRLARMEEVNNRANALLDSALIENRQLKDAIAPTRHTPEDEHLYQSVDDFVRHVRNLDEVASEAESLRRALLAASREPQVGNEVK